MNITEAIAVLTEAGLYPHRDDAVDLTMPSRPVMHLSNELCPEGFSYPCPSRAWAILGFLKPVRVPCSHIEGHEGRHYFHMEWEPAVTS